nr:MAG TPA: hypothetical protein [Caudoviricetes sp.]
MRMFAIANGRKALWQWDLNQQLTVAGSCTEVHYLDKGSPSTLTVAVKDGKADIPNVLLQRPGRLVVYAYIVDAQDHHTKVCETFGIAPRPKPAEYVYTETEVKTWSDLQSQIGDLAGLATEEKDNLVAAINEVKASSGSGEASDAVLYTEQSLTEEQKAQARENIGGVRPVITLDYSFIGNGFTWNHTATEIQALKVKKYLFDVDGCQANCNFYAGNMRVSWVDGNELKYTDIDNSGKSGGIFTSDIGGITGQVTADKVTNPDHPTDLVQYGAFKAAVPLVQSMGITGAQVGQTIKVKAVNKQGMPTAWEAADMASGSSGEVWEKVADTTLTEQVNSIRVTFSACSAVYVQFQWGGVESDVGNISIAPNCNDTFYIDERRAAAASITTSTNAKRGYTFIRIDTRVGSVWTATSSTLSRGDGSFGAITPDDTMNCEIGVSNHFGISMMAPFYFTVKNEPLSNGVHSITAYGAGMAIGTTLRVWGIKK